MCSSAGCGKKEASGKWTGKARSDTSLPAVKSDYYSSGTGSCQLVLGEQTVRQSDSGQSDGRAAPFIQTAR